MWHITELIPFIPLKAEPPARRVFFAIYYATMDDAFKRAATCWLAQVKARHGFNATDIEIAIEVKTERDFVDAWNAVLSSAQQAGARVYAGNLLTHASKSDSHGDGLEFTGGTLVHLEIIKLARLPWSARGFIVLSGCNTGLIQARGWAPAHTFALGQGVPAVGQAGLAYFSENWPRYSEIGKADTSICLWAYARGKNGVFGGGNRMSGIVYKP